MSEILIKVYTDTLKISGELIKNNLPPETTTINSLK